MTDEIKTNTKPDKQGSDGNETVKIRSRKKVRRSPVLNILLVFFLGVFLYSLGSIIKIQLDYKQDRDIYEQGAESFVREKTTSAVTTEASKQGGSKHPGPSESIEIAPEETAEAGETGETGETKEFIWETEPPIEVDFDALLDFNPDVVGWIYCSGTKINYPVVQGSNNDYYLKHTYDYKERKAGSIFVDYTNSRDFEDSNTIVYGHHIKDGSMFYSLKFWQEQEFYDKHPYMWLLTPNGDYRLDIFSAYVTEADAYAYKIYKNSGGMQNYLNRVSGYSYIRSRVNLDPSYKYILLSTCAYDFENARMLMHVRMTPVDTIGGTPAN